MSLGQFLGYNLQIDKIESYLQQIKELDIVVVASAGNNGPRKGSITYPGSSSKLVTVGSSKNIRDNKNPIFKLTNFSGRGDGSESCKPEIIVPGVDILSLDYKNSKNYRLFSGTSYSTAIVSGLYAELFER